MPSMRVFVMKDNLTRLIRAIPGAEDAVLDLVSEEIVEHAKRIVPVDTGYLRSTIGREKEGSSRYVVEATADYASYVEFGTRKMAAQPYLRPALERVGWAQVFRRALARLGF